MNITHKIKSLISPLFKLGVTVTIFYVIFNKIDISVVLDFPIRNKVYLVVALLLSFALVFLQGLRWHFLLQSIGLQTDLRKDIRSVWAGHFLNNVLPTSTAGDIARSYSLCFRGASRGQWLGALFLEKFCAIATALFLAASMTLSPQLGAMPLAVKLLVLLVFLLVICSALWLKLVTHLGRRILSTRIIGFFEMLVAFISRAAKVPTSRYTLLSSCAINIGICLVFYCIVSATDMPLNAFQCFFIVPVFSILAGLPISYGGWGVRELSGIHLLQFYGLSPELALSVTLLFGFVIFLSSLPGVFVIRSFRHILRNHRIS